MLEVTYDPFGGGVPIDVTGEALSSGLGTEGNEFEYADGRWRFNLKTSNYSATGTYTIRVAAGDHYEILPSCETSFVIE